MFQLQLFFAPLWRMGPRCSSAETQVCHRSYIIAASIVPIARHSYPLSCLSIHCSNIVNTNHPIKIKHFHMLCTKIILYLVTHVSNFHGDSIFHEHSDVAWLYWRLFKEYFQFLNRLYDITWFGADYAHKNNLLKK